jgi:hypothetical protein
MSATSPARQVSTTPRPERAVRPSAIPTQRNAADAYRVSEEQVQRARMVVARNSVDSSDCRELLDMLGLLAASPDQAPPVRR